MFRVVGSNRRELLTALAFVAAAILLRLPALLYSVIDIDESLYLLIGADMLKGVLPFTGVCDRKPFGLFALFALFAAMPVDAIVASRLGASLAVGLTGYLLYRVADLIFAWDQRTIGATAGLSYLVFSMTDGGLASNAELFHVAFAMLGLFLALKAVRGSPGPHRGLLVAAGVVLGVAVQIKQTVLFDMMAFLVGLYLLTTPHLANLGRHVRATLPALGLVAAASAVPTLLVISVYVFSGHWGAWAAANIEAHRGFVDDAAPFRWAPALMAVVEQAPLWIGALLAFLFAGRLLLGGSEAHVLAFLGVWVAAVSLCQLFLRIAADHYFLQLLPPLALLTGFVVGRGLLRPLRERGACAAVLAALVGVTLFGVARDPFVNGLFMAKYRFVDGRAGAGDTPRQIAADLEPLLRPGDAVYVFGFMPVLYHLTGAIIPTRFALTGLPHDRYPGRDGCEWVEPEVELRRIIDRKPRFIVVVKNRYYAEVDPEVKSILTERLEQDYRLRAVYRKHLLHDVYPVQRFLMQAGLNAEVYERNGGDHPPPVANLQAGLGRDH